MGGRPDDETSNPNAWARARRSAGVSMRDLERRSGVARSYISLLEQGRLTPTPAQARALLDVLEGRNDAQNT